jgi:hypothetical protein
VPLPYFSSVPAQSVPGQLVPGFLDQSAQQLTYQYLGHYTLYYWDYVDTSTWELLTAVPGNSYAMEVISNRYGLSDPPPDGRWVTPGPPSWDQVVFREDLMSRARKHNAMLQANLIGKYREIPQGIPRVKEKVTLPPSEASVATANARKRNAELQAAMARGL